MVGIGIWMLVKPEKFEEIAYKDQKFPPEIKDLTGADNDTIKTVGIIAIVSGGVLAMAAIFGILGAVLRSGLLTTFVILILIPRNFNFEVF